MPPLRRALEVVDKVIECRRDRVVPTTECLDCPALRDAAPAISSDAATAALGSELVVWTARGMGVLDPLSSAIVTLLDGEVTVAKLVDDVAHVVGRGIDSAWEIVLGLIGSLDEMGALIGLDGCSANNTTTDGVATAPATSEPVVTQRSDGRWEITATVSLAGGGEEPRDDVSAGLMEGVHSVAELVPPDSCLGVKLRLGDDIDEFRLVVPDDRGGGALAVRCSAPVLTPQLRNLAPAYDGSAPVEAFVIAPLEGDGPVRVFDGRGRRRGRPRSSAQVVSLVAALLGETAWRSRPFGTGQPLLIESGLLLHRGRWLLAPKALSSDPHVLRAFRREDTAVSDFAALLHDDLTFSSPSLASTAADRVPIGEVTLLLPLGMPPAPLSILRMIRPAIVNGDASVRSLALDRLIEAAFVLQEGAREWTGVLLSESLRPHSSDG